MVDPAVKPLLDERLTSRDQTYVEYRSFDERAPFGQNLNTSGFLKAQATSVVVHCSDEDQDPYCLPQSPFMSRISDAISTSRVGIWARKLAVESEPGLTTAQRMLSNADLKPVEPARRQWTAWNFVGFWIADSFNINTWMISSSNIAGGLSWWQSWICVWLGYSIAACFVCLTGRIGATYHISFPVITRASFGIWGSLWPVFNRAVVACIWYGVQAWIGGECVSLMIRSIWESWRIEVSSGTGSLLRSEPLSSNNVAFISFLLFWLASLPAIWFPVHKIRHLFTVKAIVVPSAGVAFFIWAIFRARGIGLIVQQPGTATGATLWWLMVRGIMSSIANFATLILNDPDFARFARRPSDAIWSQLITIPVGFAVTSIIGIIVSSSSTVIFGGKAIWNPLDLLTAFLDEVDRGPAQRIGVFAIASAFALAQLGTNIAANSVPAGTDMAALFPRWLTIRRGGYLCAFVGLLIRPWRLLESSSTFTTYLSAYSVFLSAIAGVLVADYYAVRHGYLRTRDLYSASPSGPYYYTRGIHWRAYAAYAAGILVNAVGFAAAMGAWDVNAVPRLARVVYEFNFFAGFGVAASMYVLLCWVFPLPATSGGWLEVEGEIAAEDGSAWDHYAGEYDDEEGEGENDGLLATRGEEMLDGEEIRRRKDVSRVDKC